MNNLFFSIAIALAIMSCSKNQKTVKLINGEWNATSIKVTNKGGIVGEELTASVTYTYIFDNCKLKNDEYCKLAVVVTSGALSETEFDVFRVAENGKILEVKDELGSTTITKIEIVKLEKSNLVLKKTNAGNSVIIAFQKVE